MVEKNGEPLNTSVFYFRGFHTQRQVPGFLTQLGALKPGTPHRRPGPGASGNLLVLQF